MMPYNTRRKSVSLTALGIHLPQQSLKASRPSPSNMADQHPQKRVKRVHDTTSSQRPTFEPTPPPSPSADDFPVEHIVEHTVDDEVVASVVNILKESRNRPHTVRELASRLGSGLGVVENSANPHAIISSRLNTYLKRDFTKTQPCVLERKLVTTHPKRIYFFLSNMQAQPIRDNELLPVTISSRGLVSPAPSEEDADEAELRRRRIMSPSPEVDLSPDDVDEIDYEPDISSPSLIVRERTTSPMRCDSPRLEEAEQEFSASAIQLSIKQRSASIEIQERLRSPAAPASVMYGPEHHDDNEHTSAATLLGYKIDTKLTVPSSPLIRPIQASQSKVMDIDHLSSGTVSGPPGLTLNSSIDASKFSEWSDLKSPEAVELHELDDLLEEL